MAERRRRRALWAWALSCYFLTAGAEQLELTPVADTTLFEDNADYSSGAGDFLFFGPIASGSPRRALLRFDLSALPAGAVIESASLRFTVDRAAIGSSLDDQLRVHRVLAPWGEGSSNAGTGGAGTQATLGDATWLYRQYLVPAGASPHTTWLTPGGDFAATPSAQISVGGVGTYTIASTPGLVADVQHWLDTPSATYGWILVGPEGADISQRARRLYSRTSPATASRPTLTLTYADAPAATQKVPWPNWSVGLLALALSALGWAAKTSTPSS